MKRHLIISLIIVSIAFLFFASLSHAILAGKISMLEGRVDVLKPGKNTTSPVKAGDSVDVGDIYRAKSDGKAEITFLNNNILKIASNTRAEIKEAMFEGNKSSNIVKLYRGRVQAITSEEFIKKTAAFAEGNKFEVHTPNAIAGVRGSNMIVSFLQGITGTLLLSGIGYQYNPGDPNKATITLTKGSISFVLTVTSSPTPARQATESEITVQVKTVVPSTGSGGGSTGGPGGTTGGTGETVFIASAPTTGTASLAEKVIQFLESVFQAKSSTPPLPPPVITTDTTLPTIQITSKPAALTNQSMATFDFQSNEDANFKYSLDANPWVTVSGSNHKTVTLSGVSDGNHTIYVKAVNQAGNESTTTSYAWTVDTVAPAVTITTSPAALTNSGSASFAFTSSKTGTYTYSLDSGGVTTTTGSFNLTGLADGRHIVEVKATDQAGNISTKSYTWTVDTVAPTVTITQQASPAVDSKTDVNVTFSSSKTSTYSYKLNSGAWIDAASLLTISGLSSGAHVLYYKGVDQAGNTSSQNSLSFTLNRDSLSGKVGGIGGMDSSATTATLEATGVQNANWGGWKTNLSFIADIASGDSWSIQTGGSSGWKRWIETSTGTSNGTNLTGISDLTFLSWTTLGIGAKGTFTGSASGGNWQATVNGTGKYSESDLKHYIYTYYSSDMYYYTSEGWCTSGEITDFGGGGTQSLWGGSYPTSLTLIGKYTPGDYSAIWHSDNVYANNYSEDRRITFDSPPGAIRGFLVGARASDNTMDARIASLYVKDTAQSAGIILGSLSGNAYPGIGMFMMTGTMNEPVEMVSSGIGFEAKDFAGLGIYYDSVSDSKSELIWDPSGSFTGGGTIVPVTGMHTRGWIKDAGEQRDWGIWLHKIGGTYSGTISDSWQASFDFIGDTTSEIMGTQTWGTKWSSASSDQKKIQGMTYGYGTGSVRDGESSTPSTWVSAGETVGTFNPAATPSPTFQAISTGAYIETNKFLAMADTDAGRAMLQKLNIPCIQVGSADLTGSGAYGDGLTLTVNMYNTKFFAATTGGPARIWATGGTGESQGVQGSYNGWGAPPSGTTAVLNGGSGLAATFTVKQFDGSTWRAAIAGTGGFNGSTSFKGAGAGKVNAEMKTFSGTAAGTAK
ncbi:MAG: FecR domain-containing protein [Proteobacteria bacterium]|nr:FecR domain-containing protein [Pseudomonadota bacterium]